MAYGKKIELFLKDGSFGGTVIAEMSNWNGKGIKVSRDAADTEEEIDEIGVGVYFLFCGNPASEVYIGESDDIRKRLKQHKSDYSKGKEPFFWETAVCVMGRDLDKAKIQYLEDLLVKEGREAGSFGILTKTSRPFVKLKASAKAEMDEFADYTKALVEVLGYKVFIKSANPVAQPKEAEEPKEAPEEKQESVSPSSYPIFHIDKPKQGIKATMERRADDQFAILPGAKLCTTLYDSFWPKFEKLRNDLIASGEIDSTFALKKELVLESPSAAAVFVLGRSANGKQEWKDPSGKPYSEWLLMHGGAK